MNGLKSTRATHFTVSCNGVTQFEKTDSEFTQVAVFEKEYKDYHAMAEFHFCEVPELERQSLEKSCEAREDPRRLQSNKSPIIPLRARTQGCAAQGPGAVPGHVTYGLLSANP